jgi:hypothetical protein
MLRRAVQRLCQDARAPLAVGRAFATQSHINGISVEVRCAFQASFAVSDGQSTIVGGNSGRIRCSLNWRPIPCPKSLTALTVVISVLLHLQRNVPLPGEQLSFILQSPDCLLKRSFRCNSSCRTVCKALQNPAARMK